MIIDVFFIITMIFACIKGIQKGFLLSLFSFAGLFVGLVLSIKLSATVAVYLSNHTQIKATWLPFLSFVLLFGATILLFQLLGKILKKTTDVMLMGWLDKMGGACLFMILYGVLYSVFLYYASQLHFLETTTINASYSYKYLSPLAPDIMAFWGKIIPFFKDAFHDLNSFFESKGIK